MAATTQKQSVNSTAAIVFAVFSAVSLAAFLAYRGSDVGRLPEMSGNLSGGPLFGIDGLRDSIVGIVSALLIGISWFGLGSVVVRFVKREGRPSNILDLVLTTATGAAVWSLIWFFLGLGANDHHSSGIGAGFLSFIGFYIQVVGLYSGPIAVAAVLIGVALASVEVGRLRGNVWRNGTERPSISEKVLLVLIAFPIFLALIASLAPPIAKDTLLYHFALPKAFIAQGGAGFVEGNIASYIALGNEMHSIWAMLLGGMFDERAAEAAAGATSFLFFPLLLLAVYGGARELKIDRRWSLLATLMVASIPSAFHVASSSYIDLGLALYITLAIFALSRWWREQKRTWLVLVAIFLGAALSIKLTAVFVFAAFALIVLLRARNDKENAGRIVAHGFAALLLAGAIASPWYLRTWKATGSPVFPFYMSIWKGEAAGWDVERSNLFQAMNSQYGGNEKGSLDYVLAPVRLSVTAQPEIAGNFDGVLGVSFLLGLPLLILGLWKFELPIEVKIGAGVAGIMFLFWLFSSQQLRYLLPIVPVLAIAIISSAKVISEKIGGTFRSVSQLSFAAASIAALLVSFAWFLQAAPLRVVLGGESRDEYLARNLDYYPYYQWLNSETTPDSKVWLINMRRDTYNLDRPVFSDYLFEDWTLRKMVWEARNVQELRAKVAAMGIKYVLTRHDFLFDYDSSTIVDDKRSRAENEAKLKIAKDFILDPANTIRSDDKFSLIKVFSER
jgi:hypothetical protein